VTISVQGLRDPKANPGLRGLKVSPGLLALMAFKGRRASKASPD
jgi:hypothetical protein